MLEIPDWLKAYYTEPMNSVAPKASPKANGAPMSWSAMPIAELKCYSDMLALLHREELRQLVYTYEAYRTALLVELRDRQARDAALDSLWLEVGLTGAEHLESAELDDEADARRGRDERLARLGTGQLYYCDYTGTSVSSSEASVASRCRLARPPLALESDSNSTSGTIKKCPAACVPAAAAAAVAAARTQSVLMPNAERDAAGRSARRAVSMKEDVETHL